MAKIIYLADYVLKKKIETKFKLFKETVHKSKKDDYDCEAAMESFRRRKAKATLRGTKD